MSKGNHFDGIASKRKQNQLTFDEIGNVLLDTIQGTFVYLNNHNVIVDVSKTYFGFEQTQVIGLSILLFIEDSERDYFIKFLNDSSQFNNKCYVRMLINDTNQYRQVTIYRKKKLNLENFGKGVHSTTSRNHFSIETILLIKLEDSSYIDVTLHDIYKQEFYTKMNLIGEIIFEDHRGALITGYLPREIVSKSIFNFVYPEDRVVKLHALWKCVTTGSSKLQWRFISRNGSLVFLQTEYKLLTNNQTNDTIVARNEILSQIQRSQFDELQTAWRHQCAADIKGNSSSFKTITSFENDVSSISNGQCRICVPSMNLCFTTNKLQPLKIQGNIFDASKSAGPLTLLDYITLLFDHDKDIDLTAMINQINMIKSQRIRSNEIEKSQGNDSDILIGEKCQSDRTASNRKYDSDSIVRGILNNSVKYNHEKQNEDSSSTFRPVNGDRNPTQNGNNSRSTSQFQINQSKTNLLPSSPETSKQKQEMLNGYQLHDTTRRNKIFDELSQFESIKSKRFAHEHDLKRQSSSTSLNNFGQKEFVNNSNFSSSSPIYFSTNSRQQQSSPFIDTQTSLFDEFVTPPLSSPSSTSINDKNSSSAYSYSTVSSIEGTTNDLSSPSSLPPNNQKTTHRF